LPPWRPFSLSFLPASLSLHISFTESNHQLACQTRQTEAQAWLHSGNISKDFFSFFTFPFDYISTCVTARLFFNLAPEYTSIQLQSDI
jgi:hypothetical protein